MYLFLLKPFVSFLCHFMSYLCHLNKCDIFYIKKVKKVRGKTGKNVTTRRKRLFYFTRKARKTRKECSV